jgi:hypothetical protein
MNPNRSIAMRQQGKQRMAMPAPKPRDKDVPTSGYALIVDGHSKAIFASNDQALKAAKDLKGRFPMLQIKVYDAESKRSEKIELAAA